MEKRMRKAYRVLVEVLSTGKYELDIDLYRPRAMPIGKPLPGDYFTINALKPRKKILTTEDIERLERVI